MAAACPHCGQPISARTAPKKAADSINVGRIILTSFLVLILIAAMYNCNQRLNFPVSQSPSVGDVPEDIRSSEVSRREFARRAKEKQEGLGLKGDISVSGAEAEILHVEMFDASKQEADSYVESLRASLKQFGFRRIVIKSGTSVWDYAL